MTRRSRRCRKNVSSISKLLGSSCSDSDPGEKEDFNTQAVLKDEWVQCDREDCKKWRRLPQGTKINQNEKWFCNMHPDELFNDCSKEEEVPLVYGEAQNEFVTEPACEIDQSGSQEHPEYIPHRCNARSRVKKNRNKTKAKSRSKTNQQQGDVQRQLDERNQQQLTFTDLISQHVAEMNGEKRTQQYLEAQAFKEDYELLENFKCVLLSTVDLYGILERQETQHILNVIWHYVPNIGQQCLAAIELWHRFQQCMLVYQQQQQQQKQQQQQQQQQQQFQSSDQIFKQINPLEAVMECKKTFVIAVLEAQIQIQICMGVMNTEKTPPSNGVEDVAATRPIKKRRKGGSREEIGGLSNEGEQSNSHESNQSHGTRLPPVYEQNSIDNIIAHELLQFSRSLQEAEQQQHLQNMLLQLVQHQQQQQQQETILPSPQKKIEQQQMQLLQQQEAPQQQSGLEVQILDMLQQQQQQQQQNNVNNNQNIYLNQNMQLDQVREVLQNCPNKVAVKDLSPQKQSGLQ